MTVMGWVRAWGLAPQVKALSWQGRGLGWVWVAARQVVKEWGTAEARVMGLGMGLARRLGMGLARGLGMGLVRGLGMGWVRGLVVGWGLVMGWG